MRGQIEILPRDRKSVSYEFLAQLVGEHILLTAPDVDVSAALSMMPLTTSESRLVSACERLSASVRQLTWTNTFAPRGYGSQSRLYLLHRVPPCYDRWGARSLLQRRHFSRTRLAHRSRKPRVRCRLSCQGLRLGHEFDRRSGCSDAWSARGQWR